MTTCDGCKQRGLCCHLTVKKSGKLYILPSAPCKYLGNDGLCTVYDRRREFVPECATIDELKQSGGVPPMCNYRECHDFPLETKVASPKEERRLIKKIRRAIREQ